MSSRKNRLRAVIVGTAVVASMTGASVAEADLYGTTFQAPRFAPGNINNQNGWMKTGAFDSEIHSNSGAQQALGLGTQSYRTSNAVTSGSFADQTFSAEMVDEAGELTSASGGQSGGVRQTKFDARLRFAAFETTEQVGAGVSIAPDRGDGGRMANIRINDAPGGLEVLASEVIDNGSGNDAVFTSVPVAAGLSRAVAHTLRIEITFVNGPANDVVNVYVDGVLEHTGGTWEQYYRNDPEQGGGGNLVPTTDQLMFRQAGDAFPANAGKGLLFDDLRIETSGNPTGPAGPPGEDGDDGEDGEDGDDGNDGNDGNDGADGADGANGANGARGPAGPQGPAGDSGGVLGVTRQSAGLRLAIDRARTKGRRIAVRTRCTGDSGRCKGKVDLVARVNGRSVRLGTKSFNVAAGKVAVVRVTLSRRGRSLLARRGKLALSVRSRGAKLGNQKLSGSTKLTLRSAR